MKTFYLFLLTCTLISARKSYEGYQVFRTAVLDDVTLPRLQRLLLTRPEYDLWNTPRVGRPVDVMTSPEHTLELRNQLERHGLQPQTLVENVGVLVDAERNQIDALRREEIQQGRAPSFDRYLSFEEIQAYLDEVVVTYPNIASLQTLGQTYEGRPIRLLKLSNGSGKSALFFDAGIHAREWIAPAVALFAINELTENMANNQAMLDAHDFYFLPVVNPDGYSYTWDVDRFWRKNRSPNNASICKGTDLNRNFDYNWAGGGMTITCDLMYHGSAPFSEVESSAIADFLLATPEVTFYTTLHSYGQYILYPYGDTLELPPTFDELERVSREAADAIRGVRGTIYRVGTTAGLLYLAYGQCDDWVYDVAGVPFSYTIELPGGGVGGFDLPPSEITAAAEETWQAIRVFADNTPALRRV